jgi:thiamine-monophosphate kinase
MFCKEIAMTDHPESSLSRPTIADVGERELLKILEPYLARAGEDLLVGAGDDAAVASREKLSNHHLVLTTDMLVEGTHFPHRNSLNWRALGNKAIAANLSDIAAMGGMPLYALISLGLPPDVAVKDILALYDGFRDLCQPYEVAIIGGDTVASSQVCLSITIVGRLSTYFEPALRSRCQPGQRVYVSGALGGSKAGLRLTLDPQLAGAVPVSVRDALMSRHWTPEPRLSLGVSLAGICSDLAMIDISDSLIHELKLLAEASQCGFQIRVPAIPIMPELVAYCQETHESPHHYALTSGEEYELLFTTRLDYETLRKRLIEHHEPTTITPIGKVTDQVGVVEFLDEKNEPITVVDETFEHFRH